MTSGVTYQFNCPRCDLGTYVGSTRRLLKVRIDCHRGVSYRTGCKLSNPEFSNIREHTIKCKHNINYNDFKILGKASNDQLLNIQESLFIKQLVPKLNTQSSAIPLFLSWTYFTIMKCPKLTQLYFLARKGVLLSLF